MPKYIAPHTCDYLPQFVDDMNPDHQRQLLRGYRTYWICEEPLCRDEVWCKVKQWPPGFILKTLIDSGIHSPAEADTVQFKTIVFDTREEMDAWYAKKAKREKDHIDRGNIFVPPSNPQGGLPQSPDKV